MLNCVRSNRPCSCCLPGDSNTCHNSLPLPRPSPPPPPRRLTSKTLSTVTRQGALNALAPLQLGVGVKGGCDAVVHSDGFNIPLDSPAAFLQCFQQRRQRSYVCRVSAAHPFFVSMDGSFGASWFFYPIVERIRSEALVPR